MVADRFEGRRQGAGLFVGVNTEDEGQGNQQAPGHDHRQHE